MLYLILVDSSFEIVPKNKRNHPAVRKNIKKLGNAGKILDISLHHTMMRDMNDPYRRGRPDIIHKFLLDTLSSPLNRLNHLRIFIHAQNDIVYEINPFLRPPKEYNRFKGVLYKLWKEKSIKIKESDKITKDTFLSKELLKESHGPPEARNVYDRLIKLINKMGELSAKEKHGPPRQFLELVHFLEYENLVLIRPIKKKLQDLIDYINPTKIFRFTPSGQLKLQDNIFSPYNMDDHVVTLIGGFQSGNFSDTIKEIDAEEISLFPMGIESWAIVNRILVNYENNLYRKISLNKDD